MEKSYRIQVLWIDDLPSEEFLDDAYDEGIDIKVATNVQDGLDILNNPDYVLDAIILDANCKTTSEFPVPALTSLTYALMKLYSMQISIPWFVYTGGAYEGKEALNFIIPDERPWDDRKYYDKPQQEKELFANLKRAVLTNDATKVKVKYPEILKVYQSKDLVDILIRYDKYENTLNTDMTVPNTVRGILEYLFNLCCQRGVLNVKFSGTNLAECSKAMGNSKLVDIIPIYIQRCLHFLTDYSNGGSHRYESRYEEIIGESIKKDIGSGRAKYLNRMAISALLNIIRWCGTLSDDPDDIKKMQMDIDFKLHQ